MTRNDQSDGLLDWSVTAASAVGNSHLAAGRCSDDAYSFVRIVESNSIVAAVADGAGSRPGTSAWGSYTACRVVSEQAFQLAESIQSKDAAEKAATSLYETALAAIDNEASRLGLERDDLSTTLAVAVLGPSHGMVAQVGDGTVVCKVSDSPRVLVPSEQGEYINETVFVTTPGALDHSLNVQWLDGGASSFALSTDGLRYKVLNIHDGGTPYKPFFTSIWQQLRLAEVSELSLAAFLRGLDDQTGDDKTLVAGTRVALAPGCDDADVDRISRQPFSSREEKQPPKSATDCPDKIPNRCDVTGTLDSANVYADREDWNDGI